MTATGLWMPGSKLISIPRPATERMRFLLANGNDIVASWYASVEKQVTEHGLKYGRYQNISKEFKGAFEFNEILVDAPGLHGRVSVHRENGLGVDNGTVTISAGDGGVLRIV